MLNKIFTIAGSAILIFAAYSYRQYKHFLLAQEIEEVPKPSPQIIIQLIVGFFLILLGQLINLKLKDIRIAAEIRNKSYEEVISRNDFITFNSRGRAFAQRFGGNSISK